METKTKAIRKTTDIFESQPCSRCGGSGNYSYCQMYGTRCFKCAGAKVHLTKHGQKNYDAWRAAVDAATLKPVSEVKIGDAVKLASQGMRRYYKVASIEVVRGMSGYRPTPESEVIWPDVYRITFTQPVPVQSVFGLVKQDNFDVSLDGTVAIHPGDENMPKPEAFVTERKTRKAR